ncbi:TPA: GNAT family N-acetyltransferase [Legionella pneumophila subsp. pneumophila]|uniref:GNAT family N-acetyltransferase n=1 Tax=Legionella pneumophila TaxID=446 RepID=UPI000875AED1|nr:GNAT family N-acetyltransferase [Legionella pneumophila]AOW57174.1 GNAT family N-acetyltransferase [Legionella pneumophila subsp. pneumophila]AOW59898.1 GNAT family N-acetyltransferase [Legionella pneumophila subsp. pneumophila]AOW68043.1 GNAT family N-acetyltransferase [Legionella pneumophila subsp. pneumophila]RYW84416.1 GNAT family N-acetyltransferase [Legionella pneumophila]HAT2038050.1 GNAT family N-acetyltransferase [Legionella pneumophila]
MITIRLAEMNEIQFLNQLISCSARELSREDYTKEEIEGAIQYVFGVDLELILDKTYFVVERDGQIAGCGGWSRRRTLFGGSQYAGREQGIYLDPQQDFAKIRAFFIHPKFARQGLGSILLKHCEQEALLQKFTRLEMMATLPGVKLYSAFGYKPISNEVITLPNNAPLRFVRMTKG